MAKQSSGLLGSLGFVKSPGAPVPHRKHTSACETVEMPVPATVTIVMSQHIGAPCTPCVKAKDQVFVGSLQVKALHLCQRRYIPACQVQSKKLTQF